MLCDDRTRLGPIIRTGGPGEPLLFASTYAVLSRLHASYPDMLLSVWTNGLLFPDRLGELARAGVSRITVSISAATPETAERIYDWIVYRGRKYAGRAATEILLRQQWKGLSNTVEAGMLVTVYAASVEGVNDQEVPTVRARAIEIGAERVFCEPLGE